MSNRHLTALFLVLLCTPPAVAQRNRVLAINSQKRVVLAGHREARATTENDQGAVEDSLSLRNLTLALQPSAAQQQDLDALLARQQDPASPDYHQWLSPEQYADRFGLSQADLSRITAWLESQNLTVTSVARGRNAVSFQGSARQVENAFQTSIHRYSAQGESHYANTINPTVPAALQGVVRAIHGLSDFRMQAKRIRYSPRYTSAGSGNHYLAPDDLAAIYNVRPLYNSAIDGAGQKIAVVGQTRIHLTDIQQFRSAYNLPPADPQVIAVPGLPDPGLVNSDLGEADLDIEWSGAVARKATIIYVYSQDVTDALYYAIDQNLAPVLSMSYGLCESLTGTASLNTLRAYAQRASAQGITWLAASGDSGGADCFDGTSRGITTAAVDAPASIPEVTGVGGTTFNEGSGAWWTGGNDTNQASAIAYIPETAWNDSILDGTPSAGGGGISTLFQKPAWQVGPGVADGNYRLVPDLSFASSADHDGYLFYSAGARGAVGGTSVAAPVFAGMIALLNQYQMVNGYQASAGQGAINAQLYAMAQTAPGVFHDIVDGDNVVTACVSGRTCKALPVGFKAGVGYDMATGLGTVDAFNLVTAWHLKTSGKAAATVNVTSSLSSIPLSGSVTLTATVTGAVGTPTGSVSWSLNGAVLGVTPLSGSAGKASAAFTAQGSVFSAGTPSVSAVYSGDAVFAAAAGSLSLTVAGTTPVTISGFTNAASFQAVYAPGMILAIFGSGLAGETLSAPFVPLPTQLNGVTVTLNGLLCPIYFVSPGQLNVQIPYTASWGAGTMKVSYNGQSATAGITIAPAAPGIFMNPATGGPVPNETAKRGATVTLFITGEGAVTPALSSGATPSVAVVPVPQQAVSLTVGGVNVTGIPYKGIPAWSVGATQINYVLPATAPLGPQALIVTVGGAASAPVTLTVTQ